MTTTKGNLNQLPSVCLDELDKENVDNIQHNLKKPCAILSKSHPLANITKRDKNTTSNSSKNVHSNSKALLKPDNSVKNKQLVNKQQDSLPAPTDKMNSIDKVEGLLFLSNKENLTNESVKSPKLSQDHAEPPSALGSSFSASATSVEYVDTTINLAALNTIIASKKQQRKKPSSDKFDSIDAFLHEWSNKLDTCLSQQLSEQLYSMIEDVQTNIYSLNYLVDEVKQSVYQNELSAKKEFEDEIDKRNAQISQLSDALAEYSLLYKNSLL